MIVQKKLTIIESLPLVGECIEQACKNLFGELAQITLITKFNGLLETLERTRPDLILFGCTGTFQKDIETLRKLKLAFKTEKLIFLCDQINHVNSLKIRNIGVSGIITKELGIKEFSEKLELIWNDQVVDFDKDSKFSKNEIKLIQVFTEKELLILHYFRKQFTSRQISELMGVHIKTIEFHKSKMMEKTNCSKMIGVLEYALDNNLI